MNARRLQHYEGLLLTERRRIVETLARIAAPALASSDGGPGDYAAAGVVGGAPDDDDAVAAFEQAALRDIDRALRLIGDSPHDYGICAQCGRPIPDERLSILPASRFCGR